MTCDLQRSFPGLQPIDVRLDPAFGAPHPGDTVVHLLVSERDCGVIEPKRVKVAELVRNAAEVRIALAAKPPPWDINCQVPEPVPFSVDLGGPLGDERVVNSAAYPARPFDLGR